MNSRNQQQVFKTVVTPSPTHAKGSSVDTRSVNRQAFESMVQTRGVAGNHTFNGRMLQRKCGCGNQGGKCDCKKPVERTTPRNVQMKLAVSEAGDRYEREADRVADQVLAAPMHGSVESAPPRIQRLAAQSIGTVGPSPSSVDHALSSPGRPLGPTLQTNMERRFGFDFSPVRVHTGTVAETSARDVNAHAYTVGNDIVFGPGRFAPSTHEGRRLIAHELTHVVQQSGTGAGGISTKVQRKVVDDDKHLPCRNTKGRSAQHVADLEDKAASLAERAAKAIRAHPPTQNTQDLVWKRFRRDFNKPIDRCQFLPEIAERFTRIAENIRNTETTYGCAGKGEEPSDHCRPNHFAYTYPGLRGGYKIDLCDRFWRNPKEQVATILHEWAHYVFEPRGLLDEPQGGFDTAECYSNFAVEITEGTVTKLGEPTVTVFGDAAECAPNPIDPPILDQAKLRLPCPRNFFPNLSLLTGLAAGVPGPSHFAGVSVSFLFPVTRLHDWEKTLGLRYLRFAPEDDRGAQMIVLHGDLAFRKQPWRFGAKYEIGTHLEGGVLTLPTGSGGTEVHGYAGAGISGGVNIRLSEDKALRLMGELDLGRAFATDNEKGFTVGKAILSIGVTFE